MLSLMRFPLKYFFLSVFFISIGFCRAQIYYANIKTFGEVEGFNISEGVSSVLQDRRGFIWISTRNGLYRFNGTSFKYYKHVPSDSSSLPANTVNFCYQDKDGDYWVSVFGKGLYRFDSRTEKFTPWKNKNSELIDMSNLYNVIAPFEDSHGQLWLSAATQGIVRINKKEGTVKLFNVCDKYDPVDLYRSCMWVHQFAEDRNGWFWLCSNDGLVHFNPANGNFSIYRNGKEFTCFFQDNKGKKWLGTWGEGLKSFDEHTGQWEQYRWDKNISGRTNIISGICEKDEDHLWVSSIDAGLMIFDKHTKQFTPVFSQSDNQFFLHDIGRMFGDNAGNIWLTNNQQLGQISNKFPFHYKYIGNPSLKKTKIVSCFFHLPGDSIVFVGAIYSEEGLHVYNLKNHHLRVIDLDKNNPGDENIQDISADHSGKIWISSNKGIYHLDRKNFAVKQLSVPTIYTKFFEATFSKTVEDQQHRFWFASRWYGLFCYDPQKNNFTHYSSDSTGIHHIPFNQIEYTYLDHKGNLWLGMHAYLDTHPSVFCLTGGGKLVMYDKKIPVNTITEVMETKMNGVIASTMYKGLYFIKNALQANEKIEHYSEDDGIANPVVEGFAEDKNGNVWIATHNGLSCLTSKGFINFNRNDGLANNLIEGKPYCDEDGYVFLPFQDGFQYFDPDSLLGSHQPIGPVILESMVINQKVYQGDPNFLKGLDLKYDQNNLSFEFAAFDLLQGDKLQYAYQLKGSDTGWNHLGKNRNLFFSRLSPGHYQLRLRAGDRFSNWSEKIFVLPITIHPPFWQTWWFYSVCGVLILSLGYLIYKTRVNQILSEQRLRNKIARDLHDDIGSTLSGIKLFSSMAQNKLAQEKSQATAIVERIGERSEKMIEAMSDIVWSINPVNDSLENMLVRMRQYAAEMLESKNITYQFKADRRMIKIKLSLEARKDVYLIFKEAINNAVKHSDCNQVIIELKLVRKNFEMIVSDNGNGFTIGNANGNGLENFKERAKNLGGKMDVSSKQGEGTSIKLSVPLT